MSDSKGSRFSRLARGLSRTKDGSETRTDGDVTEESSAEAEEEAAAKPGWWSRLQQSRSRLPRVPDLAGKRAAPLSGAIAGLALVLITYVMLKGCSAVRGAASCGDAGLGLLILALVLSIVIGAAVLRAFGVAESVSIALLGIGLVAVLAMLIFLNAIFSAWMALVIPLLSAATFLVGWWVASNFVDPDDEFTH